MALRNSLELTIIIRYGTTMSVSQFIKMKTVAVLTIALFVSVSFIHDTLILFLNSFAFFESMKPLVSVSSSIVEIYDTSVSATDLSRKNR